MSLESIAAYDLPDRVARYDADMEIMHPKRTKMVHIALEALPFDRDASFVAVDLGVGTGFFADRFLKRFGSSRLVAVDGAESMIELARSRIGSRLDRVTFVVGDFRHLHELVGHMAPFDVVFSSYALHHLTKGEKVDVISQARELLKPDGWFLNADLIVADDRKVEDRIQELRLEGIVRRNRGRDPRFIDKATTRATLDDLERNEIDQPITLAEDLEVARRAGLDRVEVLWKEYREAVFGGAR